jgi:hypothetical protein
MKLSISPKKIVQVLILIIVCLSLASLAGQFTKYILGIDRPFGLGGLIKEFNLDGEENIPTWYQTFTLLLCSILLATIATAEKIKGARYVLHWRVLSIIFLLMSVDELAAIHENIDKVLLPSKLSKGFFSAWAIPGAIFVFIVALSFLRFLFHLPKKMRYFFIVAGAFYVGGSLCMELIDGFYADLHGITNLTYAIMTNAEEVLEMCGILTFIYALLSYLSAYVKDIQIHIGDEGTDLSLLEPQQRPVARASRE